MHSVKTNLVLQAIKTAFSIIFPIISFKYVSSVLGVANIGKVTFSTSIVSYFALLAGLGLASYGVREGARIRDNEIEMTAFISEIFTISIVSTIISYSLLIICILTFTALEGYQALIFILSTSLLSSAFGLDWVNIVHEDFIFLTIRQISVQLLSYLLIVIIVKDQSDVLLYAIITAISTGIVNILNFGHVRRRNKFNVVPISEIVKHIKPVMVIFASSIAVTIYVSSDATMLGILAGDEVVGLYAGAAKVYTSVKMLIASIIIVVLPRITTLADKPREFSNNFLSIFSLLMLITLPCVTGVCIMSERIIVMLSSQAYADGATALTILGIAILFSIIASVITTIVFLPLRKEKITLIATVLSAILNIVLNLLLIPLFMQNGAAITTLMAEALICCISILSLKKCLHYEGSNLHQTRKECGVYMAGSIVMGFIAWFLSMRLPRTSVITLTIIILYVIGYFFFLLLARNRYVLSAVSSVSSLIRRSK